MVTREEIDISAQSPQDFLGSYHFADKAEVEVIISSLQDDLYCVECPKELWTATGIIYSNRSFGHSISNPSSTPRFWKFHDFSRIQLSIERSAPFFSPCRSTGDTLSLR